MQISGMKYPIMVDNALYCLRTQSPEEYNNQVARLLSDGYYALDRYYTRAYYGTGTDVSTAAFALVKRLIVLIISLDGRIYHESEYDIYKKFCDKVGFEASDLNTLISYADRQSSTTYLSYVKTTVGLRGEMEATNYHSLVYGLIMLAVKAEGSFTEKAYNVLGVFFSSTLDTKPSYRALLSEIY